MLSGEALTGCAGIRHAFFTRAGGVSAGIYAGLNCGLGSSDDTGAVRQNRARAMAALSLPADALRTVHQVHGTNVLRVDSPGGERTEADALVTEVPGSRSAS